MKKAIFLLAAIFFSAGGVFAQDSEKVSNPFYVGLGTGADLPGDNWNSDYYLAGVADVFGGYQVDKNWAAQLEVEEEFFTGGGTSLYDLRVLAEAKYAFGGEGLQPYLLAGPGVVFQTLSPTGDSTANFDALGGAGVQFDLAPRTHLFLEAQGNFILSRTTTFLDVPVSAGLWVGL
jgi:Outer membrane protein beta-barrel domain